eukprot:Nitzschia sp. Nitz4//scaffold65_size103378//86879//88909//NITZ4_004481-RA/size103378-processed-gene-0.151-mRNA-1//-1//CDS//3329556285//7768//frame0
MSQAWYGNGQQQPGHGGPASQPNVESMSMHQARYGSTGGGVSVGVVQGVDYHASHRSSPSTGTSTASGAVAARPPSSASTSSASSYRMTGAGAGASPGPSGVATAGSSGNVSVNVNTSSGPLPMSHHHQNPHVRGPPGHHALAVHHNPHHAPAPRYAMPPMARNGPGGHGPMHMARPPMHARSPQSVPVHHAPMESGASAASAHPSDTAENPAVPHSQAPYAPLQPAMMRPGAQRAPLHHPMPFRHHVVRPMPGPPRAHLPVYQQYQHSGYHHNPGRSYVHMASAPGVPVMQQMHEVKYSHYQRPHYESPETVSINPSISRSPSPPPAPPADKSVVADSAASVSSQGLPEAATDATNKHPQQPASDGSQNPQVAAGQSPKDAAVTEDDDAASILLQLSGLASQTSNQDPNGSRPASTIQPHPSQSFIKAIGSSSSMDEEVTVHTMEGADCAPDLTSEPSADSTDQPNAEFPAAIPDNYPTRLALENDDAKLNSLHCFLRSELLEIFVVQKSAHKSPMHSPGSSVGRVGLRCVHCAMVRTRRGDNMDEAPMAVFYPKSIAEIYRLVTSWQRCHLRKCKNLPPTVRTQWEALRESDKSRGKTHYWITSAREIGLVDCHSRAGGIRFGPNTKPSTIKKSGSKVGLTLEPVDENAQTLCQVPSTSSEKENAVLPSAVTTN